MIHLFFLIWLYSLCAMFLIGVALLNFVVLSLLVTCAYHSVYWLVEQACHGVGFVALRFYVWLETRLDVKRTVLEHLFGHNG
jgi:hypothetical protein